MEFAEVYRDAIWSVSPGDEFASCGRSCDKAEIRRKRIPLLLEMPCYDMCCVREILDEIFAASHPYDFTACQAFEIFDIVSRGAKARLRPFEKHENRRIVRL